MFFSACFVSNEIADRYASPSSAHRALEEAAPRQCPTTSHRPHLSEPSTLKSRNRPTQSRGWTKGRAGSGGGPHCDPPSPPPPLPPKLSVTISESESGDGTGGKARKCPFDPTPSGQPPGPTTFGLGTYFCPHSVADTRMSAFPQFIRCFFAAYSRLNFITNKFIFNL